MLDQLQSSHFSPCLHTSFSVPLTDAESIPLELVEVTDLRAAPGAGIRQPFSLLLLGPVSDRRLPQGTYPLHHDTLGRLDLFIVPVGPEGGRMRYEAIFN